jgi:hypothetical protein
MNFESQLMHDIVSRELVSVGMSNEQIHQTKHLRSRLRLRVISGNLQERGIEQVFSRTLAHNFFAENSTRQDILEGFLLSEEFRNVREIPCHAGSLCIEEAFFWYLRSTSAVPKDAITIAFDEVLKELMTLIAASGDRWYRTKLGIKFNGTSHFVTAKQNANESMLFAAAKRQLIVGPISNVIVDTLMQSVDLFQKGVDSGENSRLRGDVKLLGALENLGLI